MLSPISSPPHLQTHITLLLQHHQGNLQKKPAQSQPTHVCFSWKRGSCLYPAHCVFRHICSSCGSLAHKAADCESAGSTKTTMSGSITPLQILTPHSSSPQVHMIPHSYSPQVHMIPHSSSPCFIIIMPMLCRKKSSIQIFLTGQRH